METPMKTLPNLLLTRLHSEHSEQSQGPATPYTEDVPEIINVEEDTGSEEEDEPETSNVFTRSQVFVVAAVSKAVQGYRPAVVLDGHLAELAAAPSGAGFTLTAVGSDQQLSFKYEPPSPKFTRKRPHALSYRLQLLQGSQFLYSMRGLPTVMRCQRNARALEWGPAHVVFAYAEDMDLFLATLKYVEASEVGTSTSGGAPPEALSPGQAAPQPGARASLMGTSRRQLNSSEGGVASMLWGADAAALWMSAKPRPAGARNGGGAGAAAAPAAAGGLLGAVSALARQLREQPAAATAAAAAAAAMVVAAAAYLLGGRRGRR
ncbi:hypothetical protein CHLRE_17g738751v5 [Chlamydomonas reinhardtii]|uniref:Uncharacterized protein n=1 Tax=Chlamydomonas reinhardtii TaxID=3055 RepID=A0A2K3CRK6_CHLRE|nr:uncharacterized protein CHLRE_17g738751v5 [Chlamydomonas reinhardtii]PNW70914.1 hypothetical protein CHLRE_17g738751v5 [Chlamydomonas reinhardtii]